MARTWDGSAGFDEIIVLAAGNCTGIDGGPITVAMLWTPSTGTAGGLIQGRNGTNPVWSLLRESDIKYYVEGDFTGFDASAADGKQQLIGYTKDTGSAAVRWHLYRYDTDAWTHTNGVTVGDGTGPVDAIWLGKAHNRLDGDGVLAAVWDRVLTDAQFELLPLTLQNWYALAPTGGWLVDQADTAQNVNDWTGGDAHQTSISGTAPAVSANSVPLFSYGHPVLIPHTTAAAPATVDLTPATLTLTAQPLTPVPGMVTSNLAPVSLTLTAVPLTALPGPVTITLIPAVLTLTAVPAVPAGPFTPAHIGIDATTTGPALDNRTSSSGLDTHTTTGSTIQP